MICSVSPPLRNFRRREFKPMRSFIATLKDVAISVPSFLAGVNVQDEKFANFPRRPSFLRESGLHTPRAHPRVTALCRTSSGIFGKTFGSTIQRTEAKAASLFSLHVSKLHRPDVGKKKKNLLISRSLLFPPVVSSPESKARISLWRRVGN